MSAWRGFLIGALLTFGLMTVSCEKSEPQPGSKLTNSAPVAIPSSRPVPRGVEAAKPAAPDLSWDWPVPDPGWADVDRSKVEALLKERPPESRAWQIEAGCPRIPSLPAVMAALPGHLVLVTSNRVEIYSIEQKTWRSRALLLPAKVGTGLCLAVEGDRLFVARGGKNRELWSMRPADSAAELIVMPRSPYPVGVGAALSVDAGQLYLAPGNKKRTFASLNLESGAWKELEIIASKVGIRGFGNYSGFLAKVDGALYAWPDHHIQRFDLGQQAWLPKTFTAMGFRPSLNGGAICVDRTSGVIYSACGFYSRTLGSFVPGQRRNFYLRPRSPFPLVGEGSRIAVAPRSGQKRLWVYAVVPANKLCSIPIDEMKVINEADTQADLASAWRRVPTASGGSGVRYLPELAREKNPVGLLLPTKARGSIGVLGALGDELFLMRLAHVRRIDPSRGWYTYYPGINLGRFLDTGACGVFDGKKYLYMLSGAAPDFVRWEVPRRPRPIVRRPPKGTRKPYDQTDLDVLKDAPKGVGRGACLCFCEGLIFALRGGGTRDFWQYSPAEGKWRALPSLPAEAMAPGQKASGLIVTKSAAFAFTGPRVWRFDRVKNSWAEWAEIPFPPHWNGGMVTLDEAGGQAYLVAGDISMRIGRLDLNSAQFVELGPRLPDVVSAKANRLAILDDGKGRTLYIHRGHNSNEILAIDLDQLHKLKN